jgi:hypothetical protein
MRSIARALPRSASKAAGLTRCCFGCASRAENPPPASRIERGALVAS